MREKDEFSLTSGLSGADSPSSSIISGLVGGLEQRPRDVRERVAELGAPAPPPPSFPRSAFRLSSSVDNELACRDRLSMTSAPSIAAASGRRNDAKNAAHLAATAYSRAAIASGVRSPRAPREDAATAAASAAEPGAPTGTLPTAQA